MVVEEVVVVDEVVLVAVEVDVEAVVAAVQDASNAVKKVTCLANVHQVFIFQKLM